MSFDPALRAPVMNDDNRLFVVQTLLRWLQDENNGLAVLNEHGDVDAVLGQAQQDALVEGLELWLVCFAHEHPTAKAVNPY